MPSVKVNDITMYYEFFGEGEPLVFIVGLGNDITIYEGIIGRLSKRYRVLAFDNRGAGRTDKPDMPYSMEMMADDTAALMKALGIEKAHVLGVSMGGRVALALALQHPDRVKSLVLTSTFARQNMKLIPLVKLNLARLMPRASFCKYPQPYHAFRHQFIASRSYDCSDRLGRIGVPALILHGSEDNIAPLALAKEMHAGIGGSKMEMFDGGHMFFMQSIDHYCSTVLKFLEACDS